MASAKARLSFSVTVSLYLYSLFLGDEVKVKFCVEGIDFIYNLIHFCNAFFINTHTGLAFSTYKYTSADE